MSKFLLITPPLTQLNTPYPATAVLKGYLESCGHQVAQADLGIELFEQVYSQPFLQRIYGPSSPYPRCVEAVKRFLRGTDNTLAPRIANRTFLPEGPRFNNVADLEWAFGNAGTNDCARHLATLYIEDIADFLRQMVDPHFDLIRYAEQLAQFAPRFDELEQALAEPLSPIGELMIELLARHVEQEQPDIVGLAVPFPGCLYGALRCGQWLMRNTKAVVVIGGGFPNTEWRSLAEPRLFQCCHYVTLDDGELPLERIAQGKDFVRTFSLQNGVVRYSGNDGENTSFAAQTAPNFEGLPLHLYVSLAEMTNPMHRLWSSGRWNKLAMAHGCYWHRCAFCDTSLDYIARYEAPSAATVVDRMERVMQQTGVSGFHFVDEALPPQLLKSVAEEILRRGLSVSFWGNIRFEKSFTPELCSLLAQAGCVAVSGGLEVASNRLLKLIDKGVTVEQTVDACRHFRDAGIMVHTYLMYGFPTETLQECVNALETVRRMFAEGIVQSAFWHRYAMTCHSPSGRDPQHFGACRTQSEPYPFCNNEVDWDCSFPYDIEAVGRALSFATYNYMNLVGLDQPLRRWFSIKIPKPTLPPCNSSK